MAIYSTYGATELPGWLEQSSQQLVESVGGYEDPQTGEWVSGLIDQPYTPYSQDTGLSRVAPQDQLQLDAYLAAQQTAGVYEPQLDLATDATNQLMPDYYQQGGSYDTATGMLDTGAQTGIATLDQFYNPYQQAVIDTTLDEMDRQYEQDLNQLNANAAQSSAYGGSRHGVAEAEMAGEHAQNRAQMIAEMNAANYNQAAEQNQAYLARNLEAGQTMGDLGVKSGALGLDVAKTQAGLGGLAQSYGITDANMLAAFGDRQQNYDQLVRDMDYQEWQEMQDRPFQMAAFYSDILQGVPSSQMSYMNQNEADPSMLSQGIGALGTYASVGDQFGWWGDNE